MAPTRRARCAGLIVALATGSLALPAAADDLLAARCRNLAEPVLALPVGATTLPNPILFVTQLPIAADLGNRFTTFGNHLGQMSAAGRGGDLWLLYPPDPAQGIPDGCLRNLTREAGLGIDGELQHGDAAIAVREPRVHWDGQRALVSIVSGAPSSASNPRYYWQIHEVRGLGLRDPLTIERVAGQPGDYNNVSPIYGADDGVIFFTSDLPRNGAAARHLYPAQDEYERNETVTGLWRLDRGSGEIALMTHNPSGTFSPLVDSLGRIIVSRWDHLQRDIFAEVATRVASEVPDAVELPFSESFPEPLPGDPALDDLHPLYGATRPFNFKHFFLWHLQADGSGEEIINHLGRHELVHFFDRNLAQSGNGLEQYSNPRPREQTVENMLQAEEDPRTPQRYLFVDAPHFLKQSAGRLLALQAPPGESPDRLQLVPLTDPRGNDPEAAGFDGDRFRDPLPLSDGTLIASHANPCAGQRPCNDDTRDRDPSAAGFDPNYRFRLHRLRDLDDDGYLEVAEPITPTIERRLLLFGVQQDRQVTFDGAMSQLDAVEVRPQAVPPTTAAPPIDAPEQQVFADEGVDPEQFRRDLAERGLALLVVRDVTTRDIHDRQQPFNLHVADSGHGSDTGDGALFDVQALQLFQADLLSGYAFRAGRRPLAVPMHDVPEALQPAPPLPTLEPGAQASLRPISPQDGSVAALVPARRALSWQLNDRDGTPLVRERYWITFQPGEIRVCSSCHGPNDVDQLGRSPPRQPPDALRALLRHWKTQTGRVFRSGFEPGV